jgi:feruloyl esterase
MTQRAPVILLLTALLAWTRPTLDAATPATAPQRQCAALASLGLPDVTISDAVAVPATQGAPVHVPHCRVTGVIGTEIGFVAVLPDTWNGRFFMGGGGGFVGEVQNSALSSANLGYATAGTDTGHRGDGLDGSWAYRNLERQVNFGYLGVHRTAEVTKAIIAAHYGTPPEKNYFLGCSRGGGQALMSAQRFPRDFDGIVAGAPAYDWTGFAAASIRNMQALFPDPARLNTRLFSSADLELVESRIVQTCDRNDGVADGVIDDPRSCRFDVDTLPLSEAQKRALRTVYSPTMGPGGAEIYPAQPVGGEGQTAGWAPWITGADAPFAATGSPSLMAGFGTHVFKYFVFDDPNWDYNTYDLANYARDTARAATVLNATSPDLDAFKARGGKLIVYHGWADAALSAHATIRYHDAVHARDPQAPSYMRTFLLPGVLHCGGGPGPDAVDWTGAISSWVERGVAPARLVARKVVNGAVTRTRPLCPYPQKAVHSGSGGTDDEANFVCR